MTSQPKINVRKTRSQVRPYYATIRGEGAFGTGNTPDEARKCLLERIKRFSREAQAAKRTVLCFPGDPDLELT